MTPEEAATITVAYTDIESRLTKLLAEHGTAIVTEVLDPNDIANLERALQEDLKELVDEGRLAGSESSVRAAWERVSREGVQSWPNASLADLGARGRFQDHGMPHGRFAWQSRLHPKVKRIYEILHGTSDLVVSCDNAFMANSSQPEVDSNTYWPHVDQNDHDTRIDCRHWDVYQGLLYIWSSQATHASTTAIWPKSHKRPYSDYMSDPNIQRRIAEGKTHFTTISGMQEGSTRDRLIKGWEAEARRIPVPAGGLLLWSSRTTHQGWSGGPRLAQPLCWEPRLRRDEAARERKLRLAALGLPSTHWASLAQPHELSGLAQPSPVDAKGAVEDDTIHFPLKAQVRSQALNDDADLDALWNNLQAADWFAPLPSDKKKLLDGSIKKEFQRVL